MGSADVPHYTLLLGLGQIVISIAIEGRRYRHLHHCEWRLHVLETGFFAPLLHPPPHPGNDWRVLLASDLRQPRFLISWLLAIRVRLRRNYLLLIYYLGAVWLIKLAIHPVRSSSVAELYSRLHIGELVPSWFVGATALLFYRPRRDLPACGTPRDLVAGGRQRPRAQIERLSRRQHRCATAPTRTAPLHN